MSHPGGCPGGPWVGPGHDAAVGLPALLHAVSRAAEPAPRRGARPHGRIGPWDGHVGGLRHLGTVRPRRARLRAALRVHPPRLRRPGTLAHHRLVRVGVLLRRPLPGDLQTHPGPRQQQGLPRTAAPLHAAGPLDPRTGAGESGRGGARRPLGAYGARDVGGLAGAVSGVHGAPAQRVDVGALQHQRGRIANPVEYIEMRRRGWRRLVLRDSWSTRRPRCPPPSRGRARCAC